jgi:hypothetical protein
LNVSFYVQMYPSSRILSLLAFAADYYDLQQVEIRLLSGDP